MKEIEKDITFDKWLEHCAEQRKSPAYIKAHVLNLGTNNTEPWEWDKSFYPVSDEQETNFFQIRIPENLSVIITSIADSETERSQILNFLLKEIFTTGLIELATSDRVHQEAKDTLKTIRPYLK